MINKQTHPTTNAQWTEIEKNHGANTDIFDLSKRGFNLYWRVELPRSCFYCSVSSAIFTNFEVKSMHHLLQTFNWTIYRAPPHTHISVKRIKRVGENVDNSVTDVTVMDPMVTVSEQKEWDVLQPLLNVFCDNLKHKYGMHVDYSDLLLSLSPSNPHKLPTSYECFSHAHVFLLFYDLVSLIRTFCVTVGLEPNGLTNE